MNYFITHSFSLSMHYNVGKRCFFTTHCCRKRTVPVGSSRRHHRRRLLKHLPSSDQPSSPSEQSLKIILSVDSLTNSKPVSYVNGLVEFSQLKLSEFIFAADDAFRDLQNLVSVDENTKRVEVSCRRSTVQFVGALLISSLIIVFVFKGFINFLFGGYRYNRDNGGELIYKRDRSLGGKEVLVGRVADVETNRSGKKDHRDRRMSILDDVEDEGIRKTSFWDRRKRRRSVEKLPKWWPASVPGTGQGLSSDAKEEFQKMANRLIREILDKRMRGIDISAEDIIHLRRICKTSGVRVSIDTENARDSFYRTAVNLVLNSCESLWSQSGLIDIDGEDPRNFVARLSENISIESSRAARMVSAAVAARTRSRFLQAWALEIQGNHSEAVAELLKICLIHRTFPPDEHSPEMEMVARGLEKQLKLDQRKFLLNTLVGVYGKETQGSLAEALGLATSLDEVGDQQANEHV